MSYATHGHAMLLAKLGADVTVIAPGQGSDALECPTTGDYAVRRYDIGGSGLPWSPVTGQVDQFLSDVARTSPDIVISEGWYTWATTLLPRIRPFAKHVVLASHGAAEKRLTSLSPDRIFRANVYRLFERFMSGRIINSLSAAVVLSRFEDNDRFSDTAHFAKHGIPVFACPNFSAFEPKLAARTLPQVKCLLHVGEMAENKNQIAAISLLASLPADYSLEFAFPLPNDYMLKVQATAAGLGVSSRVVYTQGLDRGQLQPVYDRASLLLILSRTEAQPIVAVDALCRALPFASTSVGCMPEMAAMGGGIVAALADLRQAILTIHASPGAYADRSRAALVSHRQNFSRAQASQVMQELLGRLA